MDTPETRLQLATPLTKNRKEKERDVDCFDPVDTKSFKQVLSFSFSPSKSLAFGLPSLCLCLPLCITPALLNVSHLAPIGQFCLSPTFFFFLRALYPHTHTPDSLFSLLQLAHLILMEMVPCDFSSFNYFSLTRP
jgi:hypothetical protein